MSDYEFKDYQALSNRLASRLYSRSLTAGNTFLTKDDFYSEICYTFLRCVANFDPVHGASFKTYFINAVNLNYGMIMRKHFDLARAIGVSLDQSFGGSASDSDDSMHDTIVGLSDVNDLESQISTRESAAAVVARYPLASRILEIIMNPPDEFLEELKAAESQRAYAKEMGINMGAVQKHLSFTAVSQILGFNWRDRAVMHEQLEAIGADIS